MKKVGYFGDMQLFIENIVGYENLIVYCLRTLISTPQKVIIFFKLDMDQCRNNNECSVINDKR